MRLTPAVFALSLTIGLLGHPPDEPPTQPAHPIGEHHLPPVGGYHPGDPVRGIPVTEDALRAIWQYIPLEHQQRAVWVMRCESEFKPTAVYRGPINSTASGPWQFLAGTWHREAHYWTERGHDGFDPHDLGQRFELATSTRMVGLIIQRDNPPFRQWECKRWTP